MTVSSTTSLPPSIDSRLPRAHGTLIFCTAMWNWFTLQIPSSTDCLSVCLTRRFRASKYQRHCPSTGIFIVVNSAASILTLISDRKIPYTNVICIVLHCVLCYCVCHVRTWVQLDYCNFLRHLTYRPLGLPVQVRCKLPHCKSTRFSTRRVFASHCRPAILARPPMTWLTCSSLNDTNITISSIRCISPILISLLLDHLILHMSVLTSSVSFSPLSITIYDFQTSRPTNMTRHNICRYYY